MGKRRKKKKSYGGSFYGRNAKIVTFGRTIINKAEQEPTLGDASAHVGKVLGTRQEGKLMVSRRIQPCSCGGENENCFKCGGTGYSVCEVVIDGAVATHHSPHGRNNHKQVPLAGFASDDRAGQYSIREKGRFDSRPTHDDFDDESAP